MAEKEDRKSKRFQNTQSTPETKIISRNRIKHVNLEAQYTVKDKKKNFNINIQFDIILCVLELQ